MIATLEAVSPYSDILSIESTGGKSVHDNAVLNVDPQGIVFALFDTFVEGLYSLPDTREELMEQIKASPVHDYSSLFTKEEYGLG